MSISGCEVYYRPNRKVQGQKEWLKNYNHLTLLAKDMTGWRSLMRIVSEAHRTGFYGRAAVDDELLEKHREGLICLTGCLGGRLAKSIISEDHRQAEAWIRQLRRIFGTDLFVEVMPHDIDEQRIANVEAVRIAEHHGIGVVMTLDEHYPTEEWAPTQDVLLMIATNQTVKKREKKREEGEDVYEFSVKTLFHQTEEQIRAQFAANHPDLSQQVVDESLRNTLVVAGMCKPFLVDRSEKMPAVSFPGVDSNEDYLRRLAYEGLARRGYADEREYKVRVDYELSVIVKLDSVDQILLAWDVVDWAKSDRPLPKRDKRTGELVYKGRKEPMMVGPGRGSAASSAVCWAINLTNVNPIKHRLLFERFMNPDRVGKPDVDIDFSPDDIELIEKYVKIKYGEDRVLDVIAHSTFGPRAAINDVGRVLSIPQAHFRAATKTIDDGEKGHLRELRPLNPAIDRFATDYPFAWEVACLIQGSVARKSEHAGALLILPESAEECGIPVERKGGQKGKCLSAFGERAGKNNALLSDYGFVGKLDLLRVAELTKQKKCVELIRETTGKVIDLDELPVHDDPMACEPEVMKTISDGILVGVFQLAATAVKLARQMKGDSIFDLSALNALVRPGPRGAGYDQMYARRKRGQEEITYWHPILEECLDFSLGIMVYQESLMEIVHKLGGLTLAQADIFRKIAAKLYRDPVYAREVMNEWYEPIKKSFLAHGISEETFGYPADGDNKATGIWGEFLSFTDYSFCLAHASGYSILAYRDAWLKTHYPRQFYAALLSCGLSAITKKKAIQKLEAVREARHMNLQVMPPDVNESGRDWTVVEDGIRLGLRSIKNIGPATCAAIEEFRPFESYEDFEKRVPRAAVNITARASLIMSGAFDRWKMRDQFTEEKIDECERDLLGMSLTSIHSIAAYADAIEGHFWTEDEFDEAEDGTRVAVVGEVSAIKEHVDKKALADGTPVLTPDGYREIQDLEIGDLVVGSDGMPTTVLGVWPQGECDLYEVELTDGTKIECDGDHLWTTICNNWKHKGYGYRTHKTSYLATLSQTLHLPLPSRPVQFLPKPEPDIDPWLVGALLGDGCISQDRAIAIICSEQEMVDRVRDSLPDDCELMFQGQYHYRVRRRPDFAYIREGQGHPGLPSHSLIKWTRSVGMQGSKALNKRVPEEMLYGSPETRLAVLQGLADTDGCVMRLAQGSVCTISSGLASDVRHLVLSLGGRCRTFRTRASSVKISQARGKDVIARHDSYQTTFSIPGIIPFRLTRKVDHYKSDLELRKEHRDWRTIKSITPSRRGKATCITVSAKDGQFMTTNMVLTHNSNTMCFIDLVYGPHRYSCTVFASLYEVYRDLIHSRRPLLVMGSKNTYNGRSSVRVESLPTTNDEDWMAPIVDLGMYVELIGDQEEQFVTDSIYPEDLDENLEQLASV